MTCLFFYSILSFSKILKDDHYVTGANSYSWEEACKFLTKRESPLIEKATPDTLDCMGEKKLIMPFCEEKEMTNPYLTRGLIDEKNKQVKCISGKRVIIKWQCEGDKDLYCKDIEVGCFLFKEKLARNLKLVHKSLTDNKTILNCYFDTQKYQLELNM